MRDRVRTDGQTDRNHECFSTLLESVKKPISEIVSIIEKKNICIICATYLTLFSYTMCILKFSIFRKKNTSQWNIHFKQYLSINM